MSETIQDPTFAPSEPQHQQNDYFGFDRIERYTLPDGVSYIEFKPMNEGAKKAYQDKTSKDLVLERTSGNARMSVLQGSERHELIRSSVTGWNLKRGGQPVQFNKVNLGDFLALADPRVIEGLEKAIRKANPWLLAEMSSEDIQKEIDNLEEMKQVALKREAGETS
jgi:hypothetical protein